MTEEKKVSVFNRGVRNFRLPGGITILPGKAADVPESIARKFTGPNGYRELVDASTMSPAQAKRNAILEDENVKLKARIQELEGKKDAPVPAAPPAGDPAPVVPPAPPAPAEQPAPAAPEKASKEKGGKK